MPWFVQVNTRMAITHNKSMLKFVRGGRLMASPSAFGIASVLESDILIGIYSLLLLFLPGNFLLTSDTECLSQA